jgi:hypothetical protein
MASNVHSLLNPTTAAEGGEREREGDAERERDGLQGREDERKRKRV